MDFPIFAGALAGMGMLAILALVIVILFPVYVALIISAARMAGRYGRSSFGWGFLTFLTLAFPCGTIVCLYALGETDEHRKARIQEEERWRGDVQVKSYLNK